MAVLYRVFPWLKSADPEEAGGALFVPPQGGGRIDNPGTYSVFYASDDAQGAVAEAFGRFSEWSPAMLEGSPALPGSVRALGRYQLANERPVCDLDDPRQLLELGLRPSDVVTRDYARSRGWARQLYERGEWVGVKWWSYYSPEWCSWGLWDTAELTLDEVIPLDIGQRAVQGAARVIARRIVR